MNAASAPATKTFSKVRNCKATVSAALKKPLFVGEFGVPGAATGESKTKFVAILS